MSASATPSASGGNRFGQALSGSTARRRVAGEKAGGGPEAPSVSRATPPGHRRIAVDLPADLYEEAKMLAITHRLTVKEIMHSALAAEVARLREEPPSR